MGGGGPARSHGVARRERRGTGLRRSKGGPRKRDAGRENSAAEDRELTTPLPRVPRAGSASEPKGVGGCQGRGQGGRGLGVREQGPGARAWLPFWTDDHDLN